MKTNTYVSGDVKWIVDKDSDVKSYYNLYSPHYDSFYKSIGGFSMPETIFVSSNGDLLRHKRGPMKFEEMKEIINEILASK